MSTKTEALNMSKKPAPKDWHRADIIAAVHKRGTTFRKLSLLHGYKGAYLLDALHRAAPKYERLIAEFLETTPQKLWPSRYHDDGSPRSGRGERGYGRYKAKCKFNGSDTEGNVNVTGKKST